MQEKVSFIIKGKTYESLPMITGRLIDYYKMRTYITGGQYQGMYSDLSVPERVIDMVDCKSFMHIFCPKFLDDLKPGNIDELGIQDYLEVIEVYRKDIKPFIEEITNFLSKKDAGK